MHDFTPLSALAGGLLIGIAAAGMWLLSGRIAVVSGILGSALLGGRDRGWRLAFVAGLVAGGAALYLVAPDRFGPPHAGLAQLAIAGLLVGVGTSLANGCTSGHGVCGVGQLSPRSLVATCTFIATGVLTVIALRWMDPS